MKFKFLWILIYLYKIQRSYAQVTVPNIDVPGGNQSPSSSTNSAGSSTAVVTPVSASSPVEAVALPGAVDGAVPSTGSYVPLVPDTSVINDTISAVTNAVDQSVANTSSLPLPDSIPLTTPTLDPSVVPQAAPAAGAGGILGTVGGALTDFTDGVMSGVNKTVNGALDTLQNVSNTILPGLSNLTDAAIDVAQGAVGTVLDLGNAVLDGVNNITNAVVDVVGGVLKNITEPLVSALSNITKPIVSVADPLLPTTKAPAKGDTILNWHKKPGLTATENLAAAVLDTVGCLWLIGCLAGTLVLCFVTNNRTFDRQLHVSQEISLILCHILIYFFESDTDDYTTCKWASIGIQYFSIVYFTFLFYESIRTYCILSMIIVNPNSESTGSLIFTGWSLPIVIVASTLLASGNQYVHRYSCWLNLDENIALATFIPVILLAWIGFIIAEAAGHHGPKHPYDLMDYFHDAQLSRHGLLLILPLSTAAWAVGLTAVYAQYFALFPIVSGLHIGLGITTFFFHAAHNEKIRRLLKRGCCCKSSQSGNAVEQA